ncbi:hypothetical protein L2E82_39911 [Cichorium intybus]|uniref:Uncharacterized protein n=1 Tax=Cichorium intybus TaxID=13427 RepID=A0ACB9AIV2_CICIN|nr:hypothetical protein L2E82_39911 [Cichorium intybus]
MGIHHINVIAPNSTASPIKPTKDAMSKKSKKSKKSLDTRKIRLQHPQEGKEFVVDYVNDEGKPECSLCEKTFVTMKSLYDHLTGHSDGDWKTFFAPQPKSTPTVDNEAKVVDSMEPPLRWKLTCKRSALRVDSDAVKAYKIPFMRKHLGLMKADDRDLEAGNTPVELCQDRPSIAEPSVARQIQAEQPEDRVVVFEYDLNQPPPADM